MVLVHGKTNDAMEQNREPKKQTHAYAKIVYKIGSIAEQRGKDELFHMN